MFLRLKNEHFRIPNELRGPEGFAIQRFHYIRIHEKGFLVCVYKLYANFEDLMEFQ